MNDQHDRKEDGTQNSGPYNVSDLPIEEDGSIYHIQVKQGLIAPDILIVGDPGRAELIGSTFLRDLELEQENRGLVTVTGTSDITGEQATIISPVKTTVATSGMGTSSLEIVIQELVALNEINFKTRTRKSEFPRIQIIRIGTSGSLQAGTKLGTPIITSYAIGMDNTGLYYEAAHADKHCERIEVELDELLKRSMAKSSRFYAKLQPYVSRAEPILVAALREAAENLGVTTKIGLTVSNSGFFAPQGRDTARVKPSILDLDRLFSEYDPGLDGQRVENMEMEASFLFHFMGGLGHWAGAVCTTVANRFENTFAHDYQDAVKNSIRMALLALATLRRRFPENLHA